MTPRRRAFVTGATGFLGINLVKHLVQDGWQVVALHRASSDLRYLKQVGGTALELVVGDVTDKASLARGMPELPDAVFHVAASTNMWARNNAMQTEINVEGTRNTVEVALHRRAKRFIMTSSVAAYGPKEGDVLEESSSGSAEGHWINYFRSKWLADQQVDSGVQQGLHAVVIQPGNILGPYELHNWSRMFSMLGAGKLPGILPGAGPWCHVNSVVQAHLAAMHAGEPGDRFLVGSVHASFAEVIEKVATVMDAKVPRRLPPWFLRVVARLSALKAAFTRVEPDVTPEIAYLAGLSFRCDCTKAERVLGYRETSLDEMVRDTHRWLVDEGRL